jgi:hypothetical protein
MTRGMFLGVNTGSLPPGRDTGILLLEDGYHLLLEDGFFLLWE